MGPEPVFILAWVACAIVIVTLAVLAWRSGQPFLGVATVAGFVAGIAPIFLLSGPAVAAALILTTAFAAFILTVSYAVSWHRAHLCAIIGLVIVPMFVAFFPRSVLLARENSVVYALAALGEFVSLLAPLFLALAAREIVRFVVEKNEMV